MNFFDLDDDDGKCAESHCDKHRVKMILEYAQLLSTAHHEFNSPISDKVYKKTHVNHPTAKWVRASSDNYMRVYRVMIALGKVYEKQYGRIHLTITKMKELLKVPPEGIPHIGPTSPPACMPDECKRENSRLSYLTYYNHKADEWAAKGRPMTWYGETREM